VYPKRVPPSHAIGRMDRPKQLLWQAESPQSRIFLLQVSWKICVQFWHTYRGFLQPFPSNAASFLLTTDRCLKRPCLIAAQSDDLWLTSVFCTLPAAVLYTQFVSDNFKELSYNVPACFRCGLQPSSGSYSSI
jgi:hypothetical protein